MKTKRMSPVLLKDEKSLLDNDLRWKIAERAARSSALYRATQLRDILLFIVRQTILRPEEPIHEFDIAHRVLGRRSDFNPLDDNIVRVQMAHLRKKLDLYFSTEGKQEDTIITVALGTYKPVFSPRSNKAFTEAENFPKENPVDSEDGTLATLVPDAAGTLLEEKATPPSRRISVGVIVATIVILVLAGACAALWIRDRKQQQSLDEIQRSLSPWRYQSAQSSLWSGFFDSGRDTDVVLSDDSFLLIEELSKQPTSFYGYQSRSYLDPAQDKDLSPDLRFVQKLLASKSLGNTSEFKLAQRILNLDPLSKKTHLYSARQYMPALVKQNNVILIGGRVSNPWSELFESKLNFVEYTKFEGLGTTVVENKSPAAGESKEYISTDAVGYCVVAYMPNPNHDGKVLLLEGTSSEATEAAGDFLLSEDSLSSFLKKLPGPPTPYFEALLKTSQVRGTPLTVSIETYRTYPAGH